MELGTDHIDSQYYSDIEDTRKYKADQYHITPEQVELFLEKSAKSYANSTTKGYTPPSAKLKHKCSFMATELAKLLNNNNQDHADDLKTFINVSTWEEVILKGER